MHRAIIPLPPTSSWRGTWLNTEYVFMASYLVKHRDFTIGPIINAFMEQDAKQRGV
jgi:hypothetical protein